MSNPKQPAIKDVSTLGAPIVSFDFFEAKRRNLGTIVATSGGFDPLHPGHISCIQNGKKLGDTLVVIVNGDSFLASKKGKPFQDLRTRCLIVSAIRGVDYVLPFEIEGDATVSRALMALQPHIFAKGGDRRDASTIPEWDVCKKNRISIVTGVGCEKRWSSSNFLEEWEIHKKLPPI